MEYTFKDISEDHEISVVFAPKKDNEKHVKKDGIVKIIWDVIKEDVLNLVF